MLRYRLSFLTLPLLLGLGIYLYFHPPYKPMYEVTIPENLADDADRTSLIAALSSQENFLQKQEQNALVKIGTHNYTYSWLLESVRDFLGFLQKNPNDEELAEFFRKNYLFFQAGGRKNRWLRKMLVTGYYEPLFQGSLTKSNLYSTALHSRPPSLVTRTTTDGTREIGRYDENDAFTTFWTRREIEEEGLLKDQELVYLKDPFDAYLLHVQGSGKIELDDGSVRAVRFSGSNGLTYNSIGKYLVDNNIMELDDVNIPAIRSYLAENPDRLKPLLYQNPRYIFFTWGDNKGPRGSSGEVLTPGRSIAIDPKALPTGTIAYLQTEKPVFTEHAISGWEPMQRFVLPQDSGSAIKGTGRVDVFWGNGEYAEAAAQHMKQDGKLFFLVKKGFFSRKNS